MNSVLNELQNFRKQLYISDCIDEAGGPVHDGRLGVYKRLQAYVNGGVDLGGINGVFKALFGFDVENLPKVISNYPES